jgi:hypothetical protein
MTNVILRRSVVFAQIEEPVKAGRGNPFLDPIARIFNFQNHSMDIHEMLYARVRRIQLRFDQFDVTSEVDRVESKGTDDGA